MRSFLPSVFAGAAAAFLVLLVFWPLERSEQRSHRESLRSELLQELVVRRSLLESALGERFTLARALAAHMAIEGSPHEEHLQEFAGNLLASTRDVLRVHLVRGGVVRQTFPSGPPSAISGKDLREEPGHERWIEAVEPGGEIVVFRPHPLPDGTSTLMLAAPVPLDPDTDRSERRGEGDLAVLVLDLESFLRASLVPGPITGPSVAALVTGGESERGDLLLGDRAVLGWDPASTEIDLSQVAIRLFAAPLGGWPAHAPGWGLRWGMSAGVALMLALLVGALTRVPLRLRQAVREATAALRESEGRFRTLVDHAPEAIAVLDAETGGLVQVNAAMCRLLDREREELVGRTLQEVSPGYQPDGRPSPELARLYLGEAAGSGRPVFEWTLRDRRGELLPCEVRLVKLPFSGRTLLRGSITDISRRKEAEERLRRTLALEKLATHISTRFLQLPPGEIERGVAPALEELGRFFSADRCYLFFLRDGGARIDCGHDWCAEGIGWEREKLKNLAAEEYPWVMERLQAGRGLVVPLVSELPESAERWRRQLESQGTRSLVLEPILVSGELVGFFGFDSVVRERSWSDASPEMLQIVADAFAAALERRRAERQRQELEAQVLHSQKLESLGVMAGGIAHDFNNLLTGILGNVGLAQMQHQGDGPVRERLQQVEQAALRATELTNQMLAYSGRGRSKIEVLDLEVVVRDMVHLLETVLSKKAALRFELGEDRPLLRGDPAQVRQIVMNLLTNASESLGSEPGTITVRTGRVEAGEEELARGYLHEGAAPGPYVLLEVSDNGCGMDRETLARIFDPFFTTKFAGRGLGLAAVLGIVRGHGGNIRVQSEPGVGTTFRVLFPRASEEASPQALKETPETGERPGGTLLVVDDEALVRDAAGMILEQAGYRVLLARDGREGIETFRKHADEIDAVVLDLSMPEMSGEEVFREMRALRPDALVLLSSGYSREEAVTRLAGEGLAGFIAKPFRASTLLSSVREILARRV